MAKRRFHHKERWALWEVYEHTCTYCNQPLRLQDTTIDHIVPEALADDSEAFAAFRLANHLPDDFQINDYGNWLPVHPNCNQVKGSDHFATGSLLFFLQLARRNAERARALAQRGQRTVAVDKQLASVQQSYARGEITTFELTSALSADGLSIRTAAERLGVMVQGPGEPTTVQVQADGNLLVRKGTREFLVPLGLVSDLYSDAPSASGFLRIPDELQCDSPSLEETEYYIRRLRECFMSALIRDSDEVIAYAVTGPNSGCSAALRWSAEDWDEQRQKRRLYSDLCRAAMEGDAAANQSIDHALRVIAMPTSWDANWVNSATGEGGQHLLPNALGAAVEPLILWWRTKVLQMARPWRCLAYGAKGHEGARCRAWAMRDSIFCRQHRPILVAPPYRSVT